MFCAQVSPTYYILTAVAITDLLTMLAYLPYAVYFYCIATPEPEYQHRLATYCVDTSKNRSTNRGTNREHYAVKLFRDN